MSLEHVVHPGAHYLFRLASISRIGRPKGLWSFRAKHPKTFFFISFSKKRHPKRSLSCSPPFCFSILRHARVPSLVSRTMDALRRRAEAGDIEAMSDLGARYAMGGEGLKQDYAGARRWFLKSAEAGSGLAKLNLAECYRDGRGCDVDQGKAVELYKEVASTPTDNVACDAMELLGEAYFTGECGVPVDQETAAKWFRKGAEAGSINCAYRRGVCLATGTGVNRDLQAAVTAFRVAADSGHPGASLDLGHCLMRGLGVEIDRKKATRQYTNAADKGHPEAMFHLGMAHLQGRGAVQNKRLAAKWLLQAAHKGHPEAMHEYAGLVANGAPPGVPKKVQDAVTWYAAAAEAGVAESAAALGSAHFSGVEGYIERDLEEALKWFELAKLLGMEEADGALERTKTEIENEVNQLKKLKAHDVEWSTFLEKVKGLDLTHEETRNTTDNTVGILNATCVPFPDEAVIAALKMVETKPSEIFWTRWGNFGKKFKAFFAPGELEQVKERINEIGTQFPKPKTAVGKSTLRQPKPSSGDSADEKATQAKPPPMPVRKSRPQPRNETMSRPAAATLRPVNKPPKLPAEVDKSLATKPKEIIKAPREGGSGKSKKPIDALKLHPDSPYAATARRPKM